MVYALDLCFVRTLRFIVHVKSTRMPSCVKYVLLRTLRCVIYVFRAHVNYDTLCYDMCVLCVLGYVKLRFKAHVKSTRLPRCVKYVLLRTFRCVIYVFRAHVDYVTFFLWYAHVMCASLC